mgnify:CR=1 FL=1
MRVILIERLQMQTDELKDLLLRWPIRLHEFLLAFDQLAEVVDAVGDRLDVMMDGGIQRGTHVLKALSLGAKAVEIGAELVVERQLIATHRAPVGRIEGENDGPATKLVQRE